MNFIEKLDWIYEQSVDLGEVIEKLSAKNNWDEEQSYQFQCFINFCIDEDTQIKDITLKNFNKIYDNLFEEEWDYIIDCIMNY